jgi:hypothetical protein
LFLCGAEDLIPLPGRLLSAVGPLQRKFDRLAGSADYRLVAGILTVESSDGFPWAVPRLNLRTLADPPCEPHSLRTDAEESLRLAKIEQLFRTDRGRSIVRNLVMGPERGYARTGPAVAVPGQEIIPIEDTSDEIVVRDEDEFPDSPHDVG